MGRLSYVIFCCVLPCASLFGHHSFAAEYDGQKQVSYKGVVTDIDWRNPHAYLYIDAKDQDGKVTKVVIEGHPPNILHRTGWTKTAIKVNDEISVSGWASRDGSSRIAGREVTLPDGKKLYWGPPSQ